MNRIILIGNGFDLAHGLPTRYKDFIDDFWRRQLREIGTKIGVEKRTEWENSFISIKVKPRERFVDIYTNDLTSFLINNNIDASYEDIEVAIQSFEERMPRYTIDFYIKNKFLEHITRLSGSLEWVDIENEYHRFLCSFLNNSLQSEISDIDEYETVEELNSDFAQIKNELETHLIRTLEESKIEAIDEIKKIIYADFRARDLTSKGLEVLVNEEYYKISADIDLGEPYKAARLYDSSYPYMKEEIKKSIKSDLLDEDESKEYYSPSPRDLLFLNFNYTNLEKLYLDRESEINQEVIHIHGELDTPDNPIIFGYGDEIGEEYTQLEKLNDNHYLENIKSIRYLEADSYKRLLNFIESGEYQIFIFGHSCGNSDRTLLNTLFEHQNCVSVKVYYHQEEEKKDNFSDVVRNISRNFNNKAAMREKVVNKNHSQPLRKLIK